jgi:hypothetical protein
MVTEFTEFDRPRRFHVHVVEGPHPLHGTWSFEPDGSGTRVRFEAEGAMRGVPRWLEPLAKRVLARQFAKYHDLLRVNLERVG